MALFLVGLVLVNGLRILRFNACNWAKEKNSGDDDFFLIQDDYWLISLGYAYYLALSVKNPLTAIVYFL